MDAVGRDTVGRDAGGSPGGSAPGGSAPGGSPETFSPWTVVNLVFHHLADNGLHPVLGETGDPAVPATALLRAMGIEPGRNDENVTLSSVQTELAALRARYLGEA